MTSQVSPEEFSSPYQNGKARVTLSITIPAETLANIRAISYALGGLSVEQLVADNLRVFMFMAPEDIIANLEDAWVWDDPEEQARLEEAKRIAHECFMEDYLDPWPAFRAKVACQQSLRFDPPSDVEN